tara:strand:- start:587 stop:1222 length:636 start_codon:yes stop_codon:yes gene_type:complete
MGYLDGSTVTVDAILTKHGRVKLAQGNGLGIAKFALADDGVDYTLWNPDHPSGSTSYGQAIEDTPVLEAVPDDSVMMRYKLTTLDRNTIFLPFIKLSFTAITLSTQNEPVEIKPNTYNGTDSQYEFLITDTTGLSVVGGTSRPIGSTMVQPVSIEQSIPNAGLFIARSLTISASPTNKALTSTVFIVGATTGATESFKITIEPNIGKIAQK